MNKQEAKEVSDKFRCPKCNNQGAEVSQFSATGGGFSKIIDLQNKKFTTISCSTCGYTELYKSKTSLSSNILDVIIGG
ncbi:zinc ribbon domain-containing protein [Mycoplasmatota bacterium]|nr:zinc ribbon domain-containing protein [Mycoplasmatota bacterium]